MVAVSRSEMVAATPYGWFLWAGQDGVDDRMPDKLTASLAYTRTLAADYVLFDADPPLSPVLPIYDWSERSGHDRSEEHTLELQELMRISYAIFWSNKKKKKNETNINIYANQ